MAEYLSEAVPGNDPTMRKYVIRCRVKVVKTAGKQGLLSGQTEFNAVLLLPQEGDTTTRFYTAWLPDEAEKHFELVLEMGHPVYGICRAAILRKGKFCERPHIFVMSKGVEDILEKKDGLIIDNITVLPASDEEEFGDQALQSDKDIEVFKYE